MIKSTFKSYVEINAEAEVQELDRIDANPELEPTLLPGEIVIGQALNVLKFSALSERKHGISGALFCTNFKLSFVTANRSSKDRDQTQRNFLFAEYDTLLSNIDALYEVVHGRRKKLLPGTSISNKVKTLEVHCKDFKVLTFSFKFSRTGEDKAIITSVLHHAFPPRLQLLFAFEYQDDTPSDPTELYGTIMFRSVKAWLGEIKRLECYGWRVSRVNEHNFDLSDSLPKFFVVPAGILDNKLLEAAPHFVNRRLPTWCWVNHDGCCLLRMAAIQTTQDQNPTEVDILFDHIRQSHPRRKEPVILDLQGLCPSLKEIQQSFAKLKDICMPESSKHFWNLDNFWYSSLESTRWLHLVSICLETTKQVVDSICKLRLSVILKEPGGRDLTCLISSLAQICLDTYYRTQSGFQSLIQKEWVVMGHPFVERGKLITTSNEDEECPVFLLFLDCVWQLLQQFPSSFEFTETYLTTLWDSCHTSIFETFIFNCERERVNAYKEKAYPQQSLHLHSVWQWSKQFGAEDIALFKNPLFVAQQEIFSDINLMSLIGERPPFCQVRRPSSGRIIVQLVLSPEVGVSMLQQWMQCYLRWIPVAQIYGGGPPAAYLQQCMLVEEILCLQRRLQILQVVTPGGRERRQSELFFSFQLNGTPTKLKSDVLTSSFPFSAGGPPTRLAILSTPLSVLVRHSSISMSFDEDFDPEDFSKLDFSRD